MRRTAVAYANAIALAAILVLVAALGLLTWNGFDAARTAAAWVHHSYDALGAIRTLGLTVREAESGQRGFLLTDDPAYLAPYNAAIGRISRLQGELRRLTADNESQQDRLRALTPQIDGKLAELAETLQLRRDLGAAAALIEVRSDRGRILMTAISGTLAAMTEEEKNLLDARLARAARTDALTRWLAIGATLPALLLLAFSAGVLDRARRRTAAAEAEQRGLARQLAASLDSVSQGMAMFDAGFALLRSNPPLARLLDLPEALLLPGTPYAALADHLAAEGPLLETPEQVRAGDAARGPVVYQRTRKQDGRMFELRRTAIPAAGGFVLTVTDETERVRTETALRDAQRQQAIGHLSGGIAHDFNNLLAVVMGNLELGSKRLPEGHPVLAYMDRAMWGAKRGATLTQQLLAFARRQPLAPAPVDLAAVLPDMIGLLRRTVGEAIELRAVESAGLWPALADVAQVESALLNLALNARDAMPAGGRMTIELANKVLDDDYASRNEEVAAGDYVMLAVSDTGAGMTRDVLARAFEPFFTTKDIGQGTGLGLAMVFGFAKQSGGHVKIYSEPGEGTTVRLYLPRAVGAGTAGPVRAALPAVLAADGTTVLVVEDEAAVREVAAGILRELGYRVLEAGDGAEALAVLTSAAGPVALALLDVVLPGDLKGTELARRLAEARPGLRTLFMSGYTENAIVHHGRLKDGVALIGKPFSREQLARKVAAVLA